MFKKKKKQALYNYIDDSSHIVYDFHLRSTRTAFESYRPVDYRMYYKLTEEDMIPRLEAHLSKLLSAEVDDGNADMLDALIVGAASEAVHDLKLQRYNHIDTIRRLTVRSEADCEDIRKIRDRRIEELESLEKDYEKICTALDKCEEV